MGLANNSSPLCFQTKIMNILIIIPSINTTYCAQPILVFQLPLMFMYKHQKFCQLKSSSYAYRQRDVRAAINVDASLWESKTLKTGNYGCLV